MKSKEILRKSKKTGASALSLFLALSVIAGCSCGGGTGGSSSSSSSIDNSSSSIDSSSTIETPTGPCNVWGAPATEKIMQDIAASEYETVRSTPDIVIDTARNEYEAAQIVMTAGNAVQNYTVEVSQLTQEGGDAVYDKANINVYHMMYTHVQSPWNAGMRFGWYPDGLLPMDAAVSNQVNKIAAGQNQSIYFTFDTPADQAVGTYKGEVKLTIDGEVKTYPISLRVRNVTVSETPHNRSMFINNWQYYLGEYDSTQEMFEKYILMMYDYRIAPTALVFDFQWDDVDAEYFAEKAYEFGSLEKCSNIAIPKTVTQDGIKKGQFTKYLLALAKKSMEKNFDLLAKCCVYGIDEPMANNAFEKTKNFAVTYNEQRTNAINTLIDEKEANLANYPNITEEFYDTMIESMGNVRYVTTTRYAANYDPYIDIYCPMFSDYEAGLAGGYYENETEIWWYGAVGPKNPYPTYHIDDVLISSRMLGWLQAIYGVRGNIYWGFDIYGKYEGGNKGWDYRDEYYTDPGHYHNVNGDGFLVYPGKRYGVDGPLPSIRLESIRDGYEDYELIYAIQETYKAIGAQIGREVSADDTIADIASSLYAGTQVTATSATFKEAREQILNLSEFTQSGVCFTSYKDDGEGKIEYELFVPESATVKVTGVTAHSELAVTGGKIIRYVTDMTQAGAASVATFTTTVDGKEVSVKRYLSGAVSKFSAEQLVGAFTEGVDTEKTVLVDASTVIEGGTGKLLKLALPTVEEGRKQEIKLVHDELIPLLTADVAKVVFNFYYDGAEENLPVEVFVKYQKRPYEENITSSAFLFNKGANTIEWKNLSGVPWDKNGVIKHIIFSIGDYAAAAREDLYLRNIVIYNTREDE